MKYNINNKPLICMQTQSTCYNQTQKMVIKGVLWHSTGASNPNLCRYIQPSQIRPKEDSYARDMWLHILGKNKYNNDWNHIERKAGVNCWIGKLSDGTVTTVQTLPWDFRPWGCGVGKNGSCNDGWIQIEICEDSLSNKSYFSKIYKEACEITAYLCKIFNINPKGTVLHNGVKVPTLLCHQDSYKLGLGSNHKDIYHWFSNYDKDMASVRNDVDILLKANEAKKYQVVTPISKYKTAAAAKIQKGSAGKLTTGTYYIYNKYPNGIEGMYNISTDKTGNSAGSWINPKENISIQRLYRVRKSKNDAKSQIGAFSSLANAKVTCQKAGPDYRVFDWNWKIVY